jgi:hypothetical protein
MILATLMVLACGTAAYAQAPVADYFSTTSTLDGAALPAGTVIEAYDGQGVRCGVATANAGGGFLIHVYGNDPLTASIDEGASEGEMLTWKLADASPQSAAWIATLVGAFADLRFENGAAKEIRLEGMITAVETETWSTVKTRFRP